MNLKKLMKTVKEWFTESEKSENTAQETENKSQSGKIIQMHTSEYHPFTIVELGNGEKKNCFIGVQNKRITEIMTKEECEEMIIERDWNLIITLMSVISDMQISEKQNTAN